MAAKKNAPHAEVPGAEDAPNFEQALERLETIVEELEGGALSLEDSIARYEEGVKLSRHLGRTLDQAEKRIERLVADDDGAPTTEPMAFDDDEDEAASESPATPRRAAKPAGPGGTPELPF